MLNCPSCGRANPVEASFCMGCATPLGATANVHETRKTVTALFCDLVGSTALGEQYDPEVLRPLFDRYFAAMRVAVERHGGRVEKFIGDAVCAVFGLPVAHEDDALRAVRAGLEMQERLAGLNAGSSIPLAARIGITTGEVLFRGDGAPIIGDAMNTASRLQSTAIPGSVVIGEPTFRLVREAVVVESLPALMLKGKAKAVAAYRVVQEAHPTIAHVRRLEAPMVGRAREAAELMSSFQRTSRDRACLLFTVVGVAGAGKSRLVEEFLGSLAPDDATVLRGRCLPYGEGITYWPVAELVRSATGITDGDTADDARDKVDVFSSGLSEPAAVARGLAGIVGLDTPATHDELLWAFRRTLEHLSLGRALVVVIEDIHWAEPALMDLIESVADLARHSPIFFLCEARPDLLENRPTWGSNKLNATTILLESLGEDSALILIDALVHGRPLPGVVRARIAEAAEGNPLYVEEFVGMLIDDGSVDRGGWTATTDEAAIAVPPTIQALLSARLDRLPGLERNVAERAAIVGRTFDAPAVVAMFPEADRAAVPAALRALEHTELIGLDNTGPGPGQTFRFRHLLIRDVAYEGIPKSERAELHERLADWFVQTTGDRQRELDEILGYHFERAYRYRAELGRDDAHARSIARRAADRLTAAGLRAHERSDITATVGMLGRASELLEADDPSRLAMLPDLARALDSNGRLEEARACYDEAIRRSRAAGDERALATARVLRCLSSSVEVDADERTRAADECQSVFARHGDERGLALCWRLRGEASWREGRGVGDESALALALAHARRAGAHREEVLIADGLSASLALGPTPVEDGIRRCLEVQREAPEDRGIEMAMSHALAHLYARRGDFDVARPLAARCREIAIESGQRAEAAHLTEVAWDVEYLAGEYSAAEHAIAEGCSAFEALGKPHAMLEAFRALAQVAQGHVPDTDRLRTMASGKQQAMRALLEVAIGNAELLRGDHAAAEAELLRAVAYFETTDLVTMHGHACMVLGDVRRAAGKAAEAESEYRHALDMHERKGSIVEALVIESRLASLQIH
jgi:class 3 adenylate cyclase/tetratricopeptide (TPR) repeat protein